jgi:hypothetical protein
LNGGRPINYLSFIAYENEGDHINWHQHNEDRCRDATVYIVSMGETRPVGWGPKRSGRNPKVRIADHSLPMNPVLSVKEVCSEPSCRQTFPFEAARNRAVHGHSAM